MSNKPDVRSVLLAECGKIKAQEVGVLLSGGIDSASILFALLELGIKPTAYSFMLDGRMSSDFALARKNARTFGVDFVSVFLPADIDTLKRDLIALAATGCAKKKTDFECGWPMIYAYAAVKQPAVASGMGADGHFCISKKAMLHYRDRPDDFRRSLYKSPAYAQLPLHRHLAAKYDKELCVPYLTDAMRAEFLGTTWQAVNRPRQKQAILNAYPTEYRKIKVRDHVNLQLGDSGIASHCARLLKSDWNRRGAKSVVAIYNDIVKGRLAV